MSQNFGKRVSVVLRFLDIFIVLVAAFLSYGLKFSFNYTGMSIHYEFLILASLIFSLGIFQLLGLYEISKLNNTLLMLLKVFTATLVLFFMLLTISFITKTGASVSRQWVVVWFFLLVLFLFLIRVMKNFLYRNTNLKSVGRYNIIVIGEPESINTVFKTIHEAIDYQYHVKGIVSLNKDENNQIQIEAPILKMPKDFQQYILDNNIHEIWFMSHLSQLSIFDQLAENLKYCTATIRLLPNISNLNLLNHSVTNFNGFPLITIQNTPMRGSRVLLKFLEDKILSGMILILISPILFMVALMIKLTSSGPIFYRQQRLSYNGEKFNMLKFRSMPVDAEEKTGAVWAKAGEDRATKFGAFLRKTSLDELPQFINVLKGDMSIVGPRPERPVFVEKFKKEIPGYMQKHMVKAGITGWAQVNGWRGDTDLSKRIEYDLQYINNWSLWLDMKIILLTVVKVVYDRNAY